MSERHFIIAIHSAVSVPLKDPTYTNCTKSLGFNRSQGSNTTRAVDRDTLTESVADFAMPD